jgi:hypothetical protein
MSVGYVVAAPLWKASYRVVLPANAGDAARVQGWAVLENQSGADWKGVDLTLHAGNPVTFHQAIYASYFADRPEVPVEVLGHILPDADERAVEAKKASEGVRFGSERHRFMPMQAPINGITAGGAMDALEAPPPMAAPAPAPSLAQAAAPSEATETVVDTSFHIATPVDLARGHSASVPILDAQLPAEQLDLLQAGSTRPVTALRVTNSGTTSLPPGALTLYTTDAKSGIAFAGDARLSGLPAGESRLLAFAEDLRTRAERGTSAGPTTLVHVSAADGLLHRSISSRTIYTVTLTAPVHEARSVLVEFPKQQNAKFTVEGAPDGKTEETASAWRIKVSLQPGETRKVTAYQDVEDLREDSLLLGDGTFDSYLVMQVLSTGKLDEAAKAKLHAIFALNTTEAAKRTALQRLTDKQTAVTQDEDRLRNNLRVVEGPGDLHNKLLAALDADETKLDGLRTDIAAAQADADQAHKALVDAVRQLEL